MQGVPSSAIDLFSETTLRDPYPVYAHLREAGPVVWMEHNDFLAVTRYGEIREVLSADRQFISGTGVGLNDVANGLMTGGPLGSDGSEHDQLRTVLSEPLSPRGMRKIAADVQSVADDIVAGLLTAEAFDAVPELAEKLPTKVVMDLIGLPEEGRDQVIPWAINSFNVFGPITAPRTAIALQSAGEVFAYCLKVTRRDVLRPGSMGAAIIDAVDEGRLPASKAPGVMLAYLAGGIDTTVASIEQTLLLFARFPDQWELIRHNPALIPQAYNEILRYYTPLHWFSRMTTGDASIGGQPIAEGTRVVALFASGNRDPRKFADPDRFDVSRMAAEHLSFGHGVHSCAGQLLARLEVTSLIRALAAVVERIEVSAEEIRFNNMVHSYESMTVRLHPAAVAA